MQKLAVLIMCLLVFAKSHEQVTISGLTCVLPGTQYQYLIAGADSTVSVQVCTTGGLIFGTNNTCITANGLSQAQIIWNSDSTASGTVILTAGSSTQTLNISFIVPLTAGSLDTTVLTQFVDSAAIPANISCSVPSGGACSPAFSYQWQQSPDNLTWTDDAGAMGQNLSFSGALTQSTYYRRKTTETVSGTYAYTNSAVVFLIAPGGTSFSKKYSGNNTVAVAKTNAGGSRPGTL